MEKEIIEASLNINRRKFLSRMSLGLGSVALGSLLYFFTRVPEFLLVVFTALLYAAAPLLR